MKTIRSLIVTISAVLIFAGSSMAASFKSTTSRPSTALVEAALCIHSGWHYTHHRVKGERPGYRLWGKYYWRTWKTWSNGEGSWTGTVGNLYGGGLSFMVGTWNRIGSDVSSTSEIAAAPPAEQIRRLGLIVAQDNGSYHEWPQTSRACGLPQ